MASPLEVDVQERGGSDTEHSNLDRQSSSSLESNIEVGLLFHS